MFFFHTFYLLNLYLVVEKVMENFNKFFPFLITWGPRKEMDFLMWVIFTLLGCIRLCLIFDFNMKLI